MSIKIQTNYFSQLDKPKMYLVYIINDKHLSWEFCMRIMMGVFHKSQEDASIITNEILTNGEGLCGAYLFDIAETKADTVERQAKKEKFTIQCLVEEV